MHVIITVIIIIVILIVSLSFFATTKEAFTSATTTTLPTDVNAQLRTNFGSEKCSNLESPNLTGNARMMASQYIDTNRIKQWKPENASTLQGDFCYVNYDIDNNADDYLMAKRSCDKSDPFFASIPFVKKAFVDKVADKTNDVSTTKCVFELDKSKINKDTLQKFWNDVGTSECIQLNMSILELNENLKKQKERNTDIYNGKVQIFQGHEAEIARQLHTIQQLTVELKQEKETYSQRQSDYQTNLKARNDLQNRYREIDQDGKSKISFQTKNLEECTKIKEDRQSQQSQLQQKVNDISGKLTALQADFDVLQAVYKSLAKTVTDLSHDNKSLAEDYQKVTSNLLDCQNKLNSCQDNLNNLKQAVAYHTQKKSSLQTELAKCQSDLNDCSTFVDGLTRQITDGNTQLASFENLIGQYQYDLTQCIKQIGQYEGKIIHQQQELDELRKMRDNNCDSYKERITHLTKYRDELLLKCKNYEDRNKNGDSLVQKLYGQISTADAKAAKCKSAMNAIEADSGDDLQFERLRNRLVLDNCYGGDSSRNYFICNNWTQNDSLWNSLYTTDDLINAYKISRNSSYFTDDTSLSQQQVIDIIKAKGQDKDWVVSTAKQMQLRPYGIN